MLVIPSNRSSIPGATEMSYYHRSSCFKFVALRLRKLSAQRIVDDEVAIGRLTTSWFLNSGPFITSATGKALLCGEHSVVYDKLALAAALDRRTYAEFCPREDAHLGFNIEIGALKCSFEFEVPPLRHLASKYHVRPSDHHVSDEFKSAIREYIKEYVSEGTQLPQQDNCLLCFIMLYLVFTSASCGLTIRVWSQLPLASGLGSSASFAACLASGFMQLRPDLAVCDCWTQGSAKQDEFCEHISTSINHWAYQVELVLHGTASGVDNACSVYGGAVSFQRNRCQRIQRISQFPLLNALVVNTNIPRNTKKLVNSVSELFKANPDECTRIFNDIDAIAHSWLQLIHEFVGARVITPHVDIGPLITKLSALVEKNHKLLVKLGVSHPRVEQAREICSRFGLSAKITGAGGGGCLFALVGPNISSNELVEVRSILRQEGFDAFQTTLGGSAGLSIDFQVLDRTHATPLFIPSPSSSNLIRKITI